MANKTKAVHESVNYEAYQNGPPPKNVFYMHNVILTFANAIPDNCHQYCISSEYPTFDGQLQSDTLQKYLGAFVKERLDNLADYEYREWINGQQPFVTPRELQIFRLKQFVQFIWFWNLAEDDDLAMIFNLTKRKASNLAADFIARFRKTIIYPVGLRRIYDLINNTVPVYNESKPHPKSQATGFVYTLPARRLLNAAEALVNDIRTEMPRLTMAPPLLYDRDLNHIWIDMQAVDVIKNNTELRKRLYEMYKLPNG